MTRGLLADELIQSDVWLNGPPFLQSDVVRYDTVKMPSKPSSVLEKVQDEVSGKGNQQMVML